MSDTDQTEAPGRIALANDRTLLASERTLAAWWRTALASLAGSIALAKVFDEVDRIFIMRIIATLPVLLAIIILVLAFRRYEATAKSVESESVTKVPRVELWLGTGLLALLSLAAAAIVWGVA